MNDDDFVYNPAVYKYWAISLTRLSLGDEEQALNKTTGAGAIFEPASYGRGAPLSVNAYERLLNITDAKPIVLEQPPNNGNQPFYQVDCRMMHTFPPIKYQFANDNKSWNIEPKHYVEKVGNGTCVLDIRTLGYEDLGSANLGDNFAKDKYIIFDFETLKVGLADVKW